MFRNDVCLWSAASVQLAIARTDEGNFRKKLAQETARHAELSRSLEQAYAKLVGVGLDVDISDAP